jgi:sugar phosphate permease
VITGPLSGWLLDRYDWRMMFIVQGLFPIFFAAAWWWAVEDRPSQAKWLKVGDAVVPSSLQTAVQGSPKAPGLSFLVHRNVLLFLILNFAFSCGAYGLLIWLPTAIRSLGATNNLLIGILTALPYLFAGIGAVWNSRSSDRTRERRWHVAVPCFAGGIALVLGFMLSSTLPVLGMLCLCVTGASIYASLGPKWALMTEAFPRRSAGVALGLCNGFGNLGGIGGPYAVGALRDSTKSFAAGFVFLGGCLLLSGSLVLLIRPHKQDSPEVLS